MNMKRMMASCAVLALTTGLAIAQAAGDNLDKLSATSRRPAPPSSPPSSRPASSPTASARTSRAITLPDGFKIELYAVVPDARHMAVGPQGIVTFVGTRKTEVWAVTDRNKDRVADEVKNFAPVARQGDPERPVLLARRRALHRRAEPRAGLPGRRVLLREPGRRRRQRRPAGRADPGRGRELQPHRPRLPRRAGRQALHLARPALQRHAGRPRRAASRSSASAASSASTRTARAARSTPPASATRSATTSTRRPASSGSPTTRSTAWATTSRRARSTARPQPGQHFGHPVVRRRRRPHQRVQGRDRRPRASSSRWSRRTRTPPTSA